MGPTPRLAFSTLAFPAASLATAAGLGRDWGYAGIELRLVDGELIDPAMTAADRAAVRRTVAAAGLPVDCRGVDGLPGTDRLMELMAQDKKVKRGKLTFILLRDIGAAYISSDVDPALLRTFLAGKLDEK